MTYDFGELTRRHNSGEDVSHIVPFLGDWASTRLKDSGCERSGTLLHKSVREEHGRLLFEDFMERCGDYPKSRLAFLTVLHETVPLNDADILESCDDLKRSLLFILDRQNVAALGAVEVELINLPLLRAIANASDNEARKLKVNEKLMKKSGDDPIQAQVHAHILIDLGNEPRAKLNQVKKAVEAAWCVAPYQTRFDEVKRFSYIEKNLRHFGYYFTDGSHKDLRYKSQFGNLPTDANNIEFRQGAGKRDRGSKTTFVDERALRYEEIRILDRVLRRLMDTRLDGRGYLIQTKNW
jgi:hypothetical protein